MQLTDAATIYKLDKQNYKRFSEQNHCIYRSLYDPKFIHFHKTLRSNMENLVASKIKGYRRVDLSLAAAAWTINKHMPFATEWTPEHSPQDYIPFEIKKSPPDEISHEDLTRYVKRAALYLGGSLVGIAEINENWLYK